VVAADTLFSFVAGLLLLQLDGSSSSSRQRVLDACGCLQGELHVLWAAMRALSAGVHSEHSSAHQDMLHFEQCIMQQPLLAVSDFNKAETPNERQDGYMSAQSLQHMPAFTAVPLLLLLLLMLPGWQAGVLHAHSA
jgi:hypothetical protein